MAIQAILFDLDGTLLPMDQELFVKAYFKGIATKLAPHGYDPKQLIDSIWSGTMAMIKNNGNETNETVFWKEFCKIHGQDARKDEPIFEEFYQTEFESVRSVCGFSPQAAEVINQCKTAGLRLVLATNPIFPAVATKSRIRWAGLKPEDFELYTTYENISYSKPNPQYYREIVNQLGIAPQDCVMVGNDVGDDMIAKTLGMKVFLLTDHLINKDKADISSYPQGDFSCLLAWLEML